jgi:hypothetical protein
MPKNLCMRDNQGKNTDTFIVFNTSAFPWQESFRESASLLRLCALPALLTYMIVRIVLGSSAGIYLLQPNE